MIRLECKKVTGKDCEYRAEEPNVSQLSKDLQDHFAGIHDGWYDDFTNTKGKDAIDTQIRMILRKKDRS